MASIQFCLSEFANEKPRVALQIHSNEISRISSPINNFVEVPKSKDFELSFVSTQSQLGSYFHSETPSDEYLGHTEVIEALDNLKEKLRMINEKLDYNFAAMKEPERPQSRLIVTPELKKVNKNFFSEEVRCSCSQQCTIF